MIRLFAPFVNIFLAVILKMLSQGDVSVTVNAPTEVIAGKEFEVQINISKGDLESFSRLLQNLPAGLTATSIVTSNSDFSFDDKRARFIWLKMPSESQFTVSYSIKTDQRLKGTFTIDGKFSYIADNERRSIDVKSNSITILPSPDIDPSLIVDIADYERLVIPFIAPTSAEPQIACVRQTPQISADGNGYIVNLLVSKERKEKFAKIEEIVPAGYKAEAVEERDAIFTFKNSTAKLLWMNLPASSFFIVSYKLVPTNGTKSVPKLQGKFSYLEEDKTISVDIKQTDQDLASIKTTEDLSNLLMNLPAIQLASAETKQTAIQDDITEKQINVKKPDKTIKKEPEKTPAKEPVKTVVKEPRSNNRFQLEPEEGIYYRVQLAAGHEPINIKRYFKKYNLDKEVRTEQHEGWNKYSIGSYSEYKEARDVRIHIWNTTIIDDAFVSAYNNGQRITVQEALMVANQKWYK